MTNAVHDLTGVVDCAVISAELNNGQTEGTLCVSLFRTNFTNHVAQVRFVKAVLINAADEAVCIAGRFKINGGGAGLQQGTVVIGFVIVAVEKNQIARCEESIKDNLVGS